MDKGIRVGTLQNFVETLPKRAELGNTGFRKSVVFWVVENYGTTIGSACTAYNHAFKTVKASNPELVEGLGRAEDKKGGRKPKVKLPAAAMLLLGYTPAQVAEIEQLVDDENDAGETAEAQATFTVKRKADGVVVAEGVTLDAARELINKNVKQKKAKLYFV
jgi:hypothetical protein